MSLENLRNRATNAAATGQPVMKERRLAPMNITLAEIRELVDANPDHPRAVDLRKFYDEHSRFLNGDTIIAVEKSVVLGIIDDLNVVEKTTGLTPEGREIVETIAETEE